MVQFELSSRAARCFAFFSNNNRAFGSLRCQPAPLPGVVVDCFDDPAFLRTAESSSVSPEAGRSRPRPAE
jgi:hypothetical protein